MRAASTYSRFFCTIVDPRTVLANCTQFETPMARTRIRIENDARVCSGSAASAMPPSSSATRMAGKVSWMSAMRMRTASTGPPK